MDCEESLGETQAALVNDLGQIKALFGTRQPVQALTLLSDTVLSYAEGTSVIDRFFYFRPQRTTALRIAFMPEIA